MKLIELLAKCYPTLVVPGFYDWGFLDMDFQTHSEIKEML